LISETVTKDDAILIPATKEADHRYSTYIWPRMFYFQESSPCEGIRTHCQPVYSIPWLVGVVNYEAIWIYKVGAFSWVQTESLWHFLAV